MKIARVTFLSIFLLITSCCVWAQQSNPFDLEYRKGIEATPQEVLEENPGADTNGMQLNSGDSANISEVKQDKALAKPPVRYEQIEGNPFDLNPALEEKLQTDYEVKPQMPSVPDSLANRGDTGAFLFWVLLIIVLLLTVFININRDLPGQIYKAILNENYLLYLQRSYTSDNRLLYLFFYLFFVLNGGIFIFLAVRFFTGYSNLNLLFLCWLGLLLLYGFRHQFLRYIGYVYPLEKTFSVYSFSVMVYNLFLGLILLPVNIVLAFSPEWVVEIIMYVGLSLACLLYIIRQLRAIAGSLSVIASHPVHFFLYLCACEIMPLLILGKYFSGVSV